MLPVFLYLIELNTYLVQLNIYLIELNKEIRPNYDINLAELYCFTNTVSNKINIRNKKRVESEDSTRIGYM